MEALLLENLFYLPDFLLNLACNLFVLAFGFLVGVAPGAANLFL
jgi:hypothetical protein